MFSHLIGTFDYPSMFVVVGCAVAIAGAFTAWINHNPMVLRRAKMQYDHEEMLLRSQNERAISLAKIESQGKLITSHSRTSEEG